MKQKTKPTPFFLSLVHNLPNCPVSLTTPKWLDSLKDQFLPAASTSGLVFGHSQEFRTGYFHAGPSHIALRPSSPLTSEAPFVHIPANFQHMNGANEDIGNAALMNKASRALGYQFCCCGNFQLE